MDVKAIIKWFAKMFCRIGWHDVPNYHLFSESRGQLITYRKAGECVRCHTYIISTKTIRSSLW